MRDRKPRRLSYANVTATIALVAALGMGGAYAADKIGSKDIGKNAVKSKHIKLHPLSDIAGEAGIRKLGGAEVRVIRRNSENNFQDEGLFAIEAICP
jgi:hypothetical protein